MASSSLKYEPYAPPQVGPRLNTRRRSSSQQSLSSHTASQVDVGSPPLTAGQLALAAGLEGVRLRDREQKTPVTALEPQSTLIDLQVCGAVITVLAAG